jgi:hypothetical protein
MDDMELRKKEHIIDYKMMNANGKDKTIDFDITKEMTPVKSWKQTCSTLHASN